MRRRSPFGDDVLEEGALEIDEREFGESVSPVPPFAPDLSVAERERESSVFVGFWSS